MKDINIDAFLVGVSKSASTWLYHCFKEHPQINVPTSDSLRFFDLKYHKGFDWYNNYYKEVDPNGITIDPSPTYFRSPVAVKRISEHFPEAKFILSLRNPVERAFSQFWHEKKEGHFDYQFEECTHRFLLYSWIIEHGFYATHLESMYRYVNRENINVVLFDDLKSNPQEFYSSICRYLGVDDTHVPNMLNQRVNAAGVKVNTAVKSIRSISSNPVVRPIKKLIKKYFKVEGLVRDLSTRASSTSEYEQGLSDEMKRELGKIYQPEISRLEELIDVDLSSWKY